MEEAIKEEINLQLKKFYNKNSLERQYSTNRSIKAKYPDRIGTLELEKARAEKKIKEQNGYYKNSYEDKARGVITEAEFLMLTESYLKERECLQISYDVI